MATNPLVDDVARREIYEGALSSMGMQDSELFWSAPGHAVARWRRIFLQLRSEEMTPDAWNCIETSARLMRAQQRGTRRIGAMLVLLPGAPVVKVPLANRQRELIAEMLQDERLHMCVVLEGDGVMTVVQRAALRLVLPSPRRTVCSTVREAVRVLIAALGETERASELTTFVNALLRDIRSSP